MVDNIIKEVEAKAAAQAKVERLSSIQKEASSEGRRRVGKATEGLQQSRACAVIVKKLDKQGRK